MQAIRNYFSTLPICHPAADTSCRVTTIAIFCILIFVSSLLLYVNFHKIPQDYRNLIFGGEIILGFTIYSLTCCKGEGQHRVEYRIRKKKFLSGISIQGQSTKYLDTNDFLKTRGKIVKKSNQHREAEDSYDASSSEESQEGTTFKFMHHEVHSFIKLKKLFDKENDYEQAKNLRKDLTLERRKYVEDNWEKIGKELIKDWKPDGLNEKLAKCITWHRKEYEQVQTSKLSEMITRTCNCNIHCSKEVPLKHKNFLEELRCRQDSVECRIQDWV